MDVAISISARFQLWAWLRTRSLDALCDRRCIQSPPREVPTKSSFRLAILCNSCEASLSAVELYYRAKNMKLCLVALITTVVLCVSANRLKAESSSRPAPTRAELIGIWWPDEKTQQEIRKRSSSAAAMFELELRSDGKFAFENIPKWWRNVFGQPSGKLGGMGGNWTLEQGTAGAEVFLEAFGLTMTLGVGGENASRQIIVHVGDGDSSLTVRLFRKYGELNPPKSESSAAQPQQDRR